MPQNNNTAAGPRCAVDVLVVCALPVEFRALAEKLAGQPDPPADHDWIALQHFHVVVGDMSVVVVRLPPPEAGNVTSAAVTANLLPLLNPWLVISFGIAGTLKPGEVPARHVVYAKSVFYIDLRKDTDEDRQVTKMAPPVHTPPNLLYRLEALKAEDVHDVVMVSSEAVVKSEDSRLRKFARTAISDASVVEMEAFGVYQACDVARVVHRVRHRYWVAIKGISDAADITKDDSMHKPAADRAAKFLEDVINRPPIVDLRRTTTAYLEPLPFRPFVAHENARRSTEQFLVTARGAVAETVDRELLHGVHLRCTLPRIFYHWRLTAMGVHWVDLRFLRVLRQLGRLGYPVECLVTDSLSRVTHNTLTEAQLPAAKQLVAKMLKGLFRDVNHRVTFLSAVEAAQPVLGSFGGASGDHQAFLRALVDNDPSTGVLSGASVNVEFNSWLRYIAWRSRHDGTCLVLHHPDRYWLYSLLWHFSDLVPGLVATPFVTLGGHQGKFAGPGRELYFVPAAYERIVSWVATTSETDLLREFWEQITELPEPDAEFVAKRQQTAHSLQRVAKSRHQTWLQSFVADDRDAPEYYRGAIVAELHQWSRLFGWKESVRG
jgi:nucleoside phosphorylase